MKYILKYICIGYFALISTNSFAFENDIPLGTVKNLAGVTTISNLAVGDKAYINHFSFCWDSDGLQLSPYGSILEGDKGRYEISLLLKPAKKGEIQIPSEMLKPALISISRRLSCELWSNINHHKTKFIEILTINGKSKISELFEKKT